MCTSLARLLVNDTQISSKSYFGKLAAATALLCSVIPATYATTFEPSSASTASTNNIEPIEISVATSLQAQKHLLLSYPAPVRTSQILADTLTNIDKVPVDVNLNSANLYWPGATLYNQHDTHELDALKNSVLKQLEILISTSNDTDEKNALNQLADLIGPLPTAKRVLSALDYDAVRISTSLNPLINQQMIFVLPPRPDNIRVLGAVTTPKATSSNKQNLVKWQSRYAAKDYLESFDTFENAENSFAWVIQPDGKTERHPIAYWNFEHQDIAPGAIVYLPFSSLPKEAASLNKDMIKLLRNSAL